MANGTFDLKLGEKKALSGLVGDGGIFNFYASSVDWQHEQRNKGKFTSITLQSADRDELFHLSIHRFPVWVWFTFNAKPVKGQWGAEEKVRLYHISKEFHSMCDFVNGQWGSEQAIGPTRGGGTVTITVRVESDAFHILIDGVPIKTFAKRINKPVQTLVYRANSSLALSDPLRVTVSGATVVAAQPTPSTRRTPQWQGPSRNTAVSEEESSEEGDDSSASTGSNSNSESDKDSAADSNPDADTDDDRSARVGSNSNSGTDKDSVAASNSDADTDDEQGDPKFVWLKGGQKALARHPDRFGASNLVKIYGTPKGGHGTLEVPLQEYFEGPAQVLTDDAASTPCSQLGLKGLLTRMNQYMFTLYSLDKDRAALLQTCLDIVGDRDFGFAYSLLRRRWHDDPQGAVEDIRACEKKDAAARKEALDGEYVVKPHIRPRRVWDLWSNRVIPTWWIPTEQDDDEIGVVDFLGVGYFAVSHAWVAWDKRKAVHTPINSREWPVPIPQDTTLERVRTELLHHTTYKRQYAWLDVLCLRQAGGAQMEQTREDEWLLDVPTIGAVYCSDITVVYYYSGLGLPFQIGDLKSERHWLNRAWTLQERKSGSLCYIAGISKRSPAPSFRAGGTPAEVAEFSRKMTDLPIPDTLFSAFPLMRAVPDMHRRSSTTDLDKVAGLGYLIDSWLNEFAKLPAYDLKADPQALWWRLVEVMNTTFRAEYLFFFPSPGLGVGKDLIWCPSWKQQTAHPKLPKTLAALDFPDSREIDSEVRFNLKRGEYWVKCHPVEGSVVGLSGSGSGSGGSRQGYVTIVTQGSSGWRASAFVDHDHPIPDGRYCLLMSKEPKKGKKGWDDLWCAVGHMVAARVGGKHRKFEKVSVIGIKGEDRLKKLWDYGEDHKETIILL